MSILKVHFIFYNHIISYFPRVDVNANMARLAACDERQAATNSSDVALFYNPPKSIAKQRCSLH